MICVYLCKSVVSFLQRPLQEVEGEAGHLVAINYSELVFMIPLGLCSAATTRVGNALGRGDPAGARHAGLVGLGLVLCTQLLSAAVMLTLPGAIVAIYTDDAAVAADTTGDLTAGQWIGRFYSRFFLFVNIAGVALQLFVVSRILKYLSIRVALLILPLTALVLVAGACSNDDDGDDAATTTTAPTSRRPRPTSGRSCADWWRACWSARQDRRCRHFSRRPGGRWSKSGTPLSGPLWPPRRAKHGRDPPRTTMPGRPGSRLPVHSPA